MHLVMGITGKVGGHRAASAEARQTGASTCAQSREGGFFENFLFGLHAPHLPPVPARSMAPEGVKPILQGLIDAFPDFYHHDRRSHRGGASSSNASLYLWQASRTTDGTARARQT